MSGQPSSNEPAKSAAIIDPEGRIELFRKSFLAAKVLSKLTDVPWPSFIEVPVTDPLEFLDKSIKWLEEFRARPSDGNSNLQHTQAILALNLFNAKDERKKLESGSAVDNTKEEAGN
ncbi:MAG: hypothetical protein Q9205_007732 [Flavoplaca limonia]